MSGPTVGGGSLSNNWVPTSGATPVFVTYFNPTTVVSVSDGGASTVPGSVGLFAANSAYTVSGSVVSDQSSGGNSVNTLNPSIVFAGPNDTISSAAASTIFGASSGVTQFSVSAAHSSIVGGAGGALGTASGANTTLVGGSGISVFDVTGPNSLAVGGSGVTGINEAGSTGAETIGTDPLGNSGSLVAFLGSGADTVVGGSGASTIVGGTGNDVFAFVKGHAGGSEVILGFNDKTDNFAFGGYGYSPTNEPAEHVTKFDGITSDVITLSDNTTVTLVGIDHKIF